LHGGELHDRRPARQPHADLPWPARAEAFFIIAVLDFEDDSTADPLANDSGQECAPALRAAGLVAHLAGWAGHLVPRHGAAERGRRTGLDLDAHRLRRAHRPARKTRGE